MLEKLKTILIFFGVFVAIVMFIMILLAIRRRKKFKAFLAEPLVDHLNDSLNSGKFEDWRERRSDVYIYGQMAKYAEQAAFESIPKRKRFDKEGQYTELSQQKIAENMYMMNSLFTKNDGYALNSEYGNFIREYRPYYTVNDFSKSIMEYFSFRQNPSLFTKPEIIPEEIPESEPIKGQVSDEKINLKKDPQEYVSDPEEEVDTYEDVPVINPAVSYRNTVVHFSTSVTVDHTIMDVLCKYTDKLAKRSCEKNGNAITDANGDQTSEYKDACRNNYNKLCRIFFDNMRFREEFVKWVVSEHYNMDDVTMFNELIPMYIRHLKGKG